MNEILDYHGKTKNIADFEGKPVYVGHRDGGSRGFVQDGTLYEFSLGHKETVDPSPLIQSVAQNCPRKLLKVVAQDKINKINVLPEPSPIEVTAKQAFVKLSKK